MRPAHAPPARRDDVRMLVVDVTGSRGSRESTASQDPELVDASFARIAEFLRPGDVLVVNDAATLPASLAGHTLSGAEVELRLIGPTDADTWRAVLFGQGDWHQRTEDRPPPPLLAPGEVVLLGGSLRAAVVSRSSLSPRLIEVSFDREGSDLWEALYAAGKPVQYSYLSDELALWSVQTVYGGRPWAAEMPSAGRPITWSLLLALRRRGVSVVSITHAAGLSATGDPAIDRALPLPERFDIPEATVRAIARARAAHGRVIAVGTTVVRALEGCAAQHGGELRPGTGTTDLVMNASFERCIVDGLLTGVHDPGESHFALLSAFADAETLARAWSHAMDLGYRSHEFGDTSLIMSASA